MIDFVLKAYELKDEMRAGWKLRGIRNPESVADHSWGTALLCWLYAPQAGKAESIDRERAVSMAVFHDIAEAEMGDVATRVYESERSVSPSEKQRLERSAFSLMYGLLQEGSDSLEDSTAGTDDGETVAPESNKASTAAEELSALWQEYERGVSPTARFVRDMNLCDMCAQALIYQGSRRYDPEAESHEFRHFGNLDEFFETSRRRISTTIGAQLFAVIEGRYRSILDTDARP